mgnify:CR=1 FL=1
MSRRSELRSIAYHREIARELSEATIALALRNLVRAETQGTTHQVYIAKWRELLARPWPELCEAIQTDSEPMRDLRQCSPFAGALSPQQRWQLWASVGAEPR